MATPSTTITCPTTCSDLTPVGAWSSCNPVVNAGEIEEFLYTNVGNPLTDESDAAEWVTRKAIAGATKINSIFMKGSQPEAEGEFIKISRNTNVIITKTRKIVGDIFETNATNHELVRQFDCPRAILGWFRTAGGLLYGGNTGIAGTVTIKEVIPDDRKQLITYKFEFTWEAKISPNRTTSPF